MNRFFPLQTHESPKVIPEAVYLRAYEVYCHLYGEQHAMIDLEGRGCRGGWGMLEFIAFLYAHSFSRSEWRHRVDEALKSPPPKSSPAKGTEEPPR